MNWKRRIVYIVALLFVVSNFYLIVKEDSKIVRSEFVDEIKRITIQDLVISKEKPGVITPAEEEYVYFQSSLSDFENFLVKEGEEVEYDTPLFEYSTRNIDLDIQQYEAEISKLESDIEATEDSINNLQKLMANLPKKSKGDNKESVHSNEVLKSTIMAQIYEKEWQLENIESELEKYEDLLASTEENLDTLVVESPLSGVVKKINHDLQNPLITISSAEMHIKGLLEEEEISEIQEGMAVIVSTAKGRFDGVISNVAFRPETDPQVGTKSQYEFVIDLIDNEETELEEEHIDMESDEEEFDPEEETAFDEEVDSELNMEEEFLSEEPIELKEGEHVQAKIIISETEDVFTLPNEAIKSGKIFVLKDNGKIETRPVELGMSINGVTEIIGEVEEGELAVNNPGSLKNNNRFTTPLQLSKMNIKDIKNMGKKEAFRHFAIGFLNR